jgi:hypothetical protein
VLLVRVAGLRSFLSLIVLPSRFFVALVLLAEPRLDNDHAWPCAVSLFDVRLHEFCVMTVKCL